MDDVLGFSAEQVSHLTGLTNRRLRYWDATEFFTPAFHEDARRSPWARVYSFRDVVGLRAIAEMRQRFAIPLQHLRKVGAELRARYEEPWSQVTFFVVGKRVFFQDAESEAIAVANHTQQLVMPFELVRVEGDVRRRIEDVRRRTSDQFGRVVRHRYVAENRPILEGTRIPASAIWEFREAGFDDADILREYPQLSAEDVEAAWAFEAKRRKKTG